MRSRQGAVLTELGEMLLPDATDVVRRTDALVRRAARAVRGETGHLNIGFGLSSIELAPQAVAAFRKHYPEADITLDDMSSDAQVNRLRSGELHVGFARLPVPDDIGRILVQRDRLALAVPEHDAPPGDPADLGAWLETRRFIRLDPLRGRGQANQVERFLASCGARPRVLQDAQDQLTILALVSAGVGVALVPAGARLIAPSTVRIVPLDHEAASWQIGVVWSRSQRTPLINNFLSVVRGLFVVGG
ncbi:LysR family substrate-binding domain-containing protein [Streptomyces sp. NPDC006458]|uniref:LysR family substrate-binding domain-containing protein n=1 Tax=Streptomyces sp. NPDC006458 TaxID=3154302 RepID=UPI0033AB3E06